MTSRPPSSTRATRPSARLVVHDVRLVRERMADGSEQVKALVECEQQGCEIRANECARCSRFVRIEPHEAGYVLLCHAKDEPCPPGQEPARGLDSAGELEHEVPPADDER